MHQHVRRLPVVAASAILALSSLSACSTGSTAAEEAPSTEQTVGTVDEGAFPVTIEHAFGATTIEEEPKKVATLGWSDQDVVLSLGVVPVGSTKLTWGGNAAGSSDWFDAELEELGGTQPVRYDDADGAPVEEIAKLSPDVILATNSGITEAEYRKLSRIAPVVAFPEAPWVTPWQQQLSMVGQALGRNTAAQAVTLETEAAMDAATEANPQLAGKSVVWSYLTTADLSSIGIYGAEDNRVRLMEEFGMLTPPIVTSVVKKGEYYGSISAERATEVEADVLLTYAETPTDLDTFTRDKLLGEIPALKAGHAHAEQDKHVGLAITNPSALSIPFIVEHFLPHVTAAVDGQS